MPTPNFLIIGERRSGTTSMARWIQCHPEIFLHPQMDIGYFVDKELVGSKHWKKGKADYKKWNQEHSKEEYLNYFENANSQIAIGEKSADYLFWHPSHQRIKEYFSDVKLIITLRNPIERAWSMYWNELGKGRETLSFEDAIEQEDQRIAESDYARDHLSYKTRGFYDQSISKLLESFPKQQIKVFILEEVRKNPKKHLGDLYNFLGVDPLKGYDNIKQSYNANWTAIPKPFWKSNSLLTAFEAAYFKGTALIARKVLFRKNLYKRRKFQINMAKPFRYSKSDVQISKAFRNRLQDIYRPHIKNLENILHRDLSIWLDDSLKALKSDSLI